MIAPLTATLGPLGRARGRPPGFDPGAVGTVLGWWAASAQAYSDDAPVGALVDSGPHGFTLTGSGGRRPTFKTGIVHGQPVLRFAGGQALVGDFGSLFAQPNTVFIVASIGASPGYLCDGNDTARWILTEGIFIANQLSAYAGNYTNTSFANAPPQGPALYMAGYNGASGAIWKNGVSQASGDLGTTGIADLTLGARHTIEDFLTGDVAELLIYHSALDSTQRLAVETYLNTKYALY